MKTHETSQRIFASVPNRRRPTSSSKTLSSTFHQRTRPARQCCALHVTARENVFSGALSGGQARSDICSPWSLRSIQNSVYRVLSIGSDVFLKPCRKSVFAFYPRPVYLCACVDWWCLCHSVAAAVEFCLDVCACILLNGSEQANKKRVYALLGECKANLQPRYAINAAAFMLRKGRQHNRLRRKSQEFNTLREKVVR